VAKNSFGHFVDNPLFYTEKHRDVYGAAKASPDQLLALTSKVKNNSQTRETPPVFWFLCRQ
jgi:hypothetical protein